MDSLEHKPEISVVVPVYWNMDINILVLRPSVNILKAGRGCRNLVAY